MRRIFISGPYTQGDRSENVRNAIWMADFLLSAGHAPYCPHLTHFQDLLFPRPWEVWMRLDEAWLLQCEAVFRLPGESRGADRECALAERHGIPVFTDRRELLEWARRSEDA